MRERGKPGQAGQTGNPVAARARPTLRRSMTSPLPWPRAGLRYNDPFPPRSSGVAGNGDGSNERRTRTCRNVHLQPMRPVPKRAIPRRAVPKNRLRPPASHPA